MRGWAIELVLIALLLPFVVAIVDLFALCRRHRVGSAPAAAGAAQPRSSSGCSSGSFSRVFVCSAPGRPARRGRRTPERARAGDWPALALARTARRRRAAAGWSRATGSSPRRAVAPEEQLAGHTVALLAPARSSRCSSSRRTRSRCSSCCRRCTSGSGCRRSAIARPPVRLGLFALGLVGPAIVVLLARLALRARARRPVVPARAGRRRVRQDDAGRDRARRRRRRRAARGGRRRPLRAVPGRAGAGPARADARARADDRARACARRRARAGTARAQSAGS